MRGEQAAAGESRRPLRRLVPAAPAALVAAVAAPVLLHGGFTGASRSLFVGLALIALAIAIARDDGQLAELARSPTVLCIAGLCLVSLASSAWTVGEPGDALRAGLVLGAVAAVALVAGRVVTTHGVGVLAAVIAGLAMAEAVAGLASAALASEPWAQRIGGSWRPGGTFEYPPALVVLQISALPALAWAMLHQRRAVALAGAAGAALAGMVIALADSRVGLALAVALMLGGVAVAPSLGLTWRRVLMLASVPVGAGVAAHLLQGGYAAPLESGEGAAGVVALAVIVAAGVGAWAALRDGRENVDYQRKLSHRRADARGPRWTLGIAGCLLALSAIGAIAVFSTPSDGPGVEPVSGLDHGRTAEWSAAVDVATDRPLTGSGADSYARAAVGDGEASSIYAHSLPLEAWAELGPLGLALVLGLYATTAMLLWRLRRDPRSWLFAPAVAAFLVVNLVDWQWHLAGAAAVWALALGACLALDPKPRPAT